MHFADFRWALEICSFFSGSCAKLEKNKTPLQLGQEGRLQMGGEHACPGAILPAEAFAGWLLSGRSWSMSRGWTGKWCACRWLRFGVSIWAEVVVRRAFLAQRWLFKMNSSLLQPPNLKSSLGCFPAPQSEFSACVAVSSSELLVRLGPRGCEQLVLGRGWRCDDGWCPPALQHLLPRLPLRMRPVSIHDPCE